MSAARWGFITLGVAIPLSTALDNFLLIAILAVLIGDGRAVWQTVTQNPVARACVLLFGALLIGTTYGVATFDMALNILGKYADLAFVPLLMVAGRDPKTRRHAVTAFLAVMLITAVLSWLVELRKMAGFSGIHPLHIHSATGIIRSPTSHDKTAVISMTARNAVTA